MQAISALKRKGVASMFQFVPLHKLSIVCKIVCYVCSRAKRLQAKIVQGMLLPRVTNPPPN